MDIPSSNDLQDLSVFEEEAFEEFEDLDDPDGGDLIENLINDYQKNSVALHEAFKGALPHDQALAERSVHSLKSASDFLGGRRLARVCAAVESKVRGAESFDHDQIVNLIATELSAFRSELSAFFDRRRAKKAP